MPDAAKKSSALEPRHIRSFALAGAVVGVVLLPIAAAQANPTAPSSPPAAGSPAGGPQSSAPAPAPTRTAAQPVGDEYCGATVTVGAAGSAVQAQACVEQVDGTASAKVYVSDAGPQDQSVTLNLTRTDGTLVQVRCIVTAGDTSSTCETAALPTTGGTGAFNAIAELAGEGRSAADGVLHAESGLVDPSRAGNAAGADGSTVVTEQ